MSTRKVKTQEFLQAVNDRAYEIYEERNAKGIHGSDMHDWLQAEKEMRKKFNIK